MPFVNFWITFFCWFQVPYKSTWLNMRIPNKDYLFSNFILLFKHYSSYLSVYLFIWNHQSWWTPKCTFECLCVVSTWRIYSVTDKNFSIFGAIWMKSPFRRGPQCFLDFYHWFDITLTLILAWTFHIPAHCPTSSSQVTYLTTNFEVWTSNTEHSFLTKKRITKVPLVSSW